MAASSTKGAVVGCKQLGDAKCVRPEGFERPALLTGGRCSAPLELRSEGWVFESLRRQACIKERKASECDCEQCTQITLSLDRLHLARPGWHSAFAGTNGGKGCSCPLHDYAPQAAAATAADATAATATSEAAARQVRMWL